MKIHFIHKLFINMLLVVSLLLLGIGVFAPLMTLSKFYLFQNHVSLFIALEDLIVQSEWLLFVIILVFSIIFPIVKTLFLFLVLNTGTDRKPVRRRYMNWLSHIGKWSMLDVFVLALLLVTVKLDVIADVQIHYGIYAFSASVFLTMLITQWLNWLSAGS